MSFRLTGILAIAALFLGLLILFWDRDADTDRARLEQARRAFRFDPARVDRLVIEADGATIECRLRKRQWHLTRPIAARADPVAIERLLGALQELPRGDIILPPRRAAKAYAPYGLDEPRAILSIIEGSRTNRILIGRQTPLGDGVYVRQSDHAGLARVQTLLLDLIPASANALRDHSLLTGAPASIERLDIRSPAGYIQLARDPRGQWRMFQPAAARVDPAIVSALIEKLLSCPVVHFVQDSVSDLSPYGLDSRTAVTAVLNTDSGDGSQMLALGEPLANDATLVYARLQAETSVYAVPAEVRQALLVRPDELRDRRLPGIEPDTVGRVRIEENETVLEFFRDENDVWQLAAPIQAPADPDRIRELFRTWADVRLTAFETAPPTNAPPFARRLRIESRHDPVSVIDIQAGRHPDRPDSIRVAVEGDSATAVAQPARLLELPLNPLAYRSRDLLAIPPDDIAALRFTHRGEVTLVEPDAATGLWPSSMPWIEPLLASLAPLRAEAFLSDTPGKTGDFDRPYLSLAIRRRGQGGLAATLLIGDELSPGGPRRAALRGRDLVFTLSPSTVEALSPPAPETAE